MIKLDSFHFLLSDVDLHYRQLLSVGTASASVAPHFDNFK